MTDEGIAEVYALAREAFSGGQRGFQLQAYPFRMTAENLAKFRHDPNMPFWRNLKEGSDAFEVTKRETEGRRLRRPLRLQRRRHGLHARPDARARAGREGGPGPARGRRAHRQGHAGRAPRLCRWRRPRELPRRPAADAGFAVLDTRPRRNLGDVSRPDALAQGPQEIPMDEPAARRAGRDRGRQGRLRPDGPRCRRQAGESPSRSRSPPRRRPPRRRRTGGRRASPSTSACSAACSAREEVPARAAGGRRGRRPGCRARRASRGSAAPPVGRDAGQRSRRRPRRPRRRSARSMPARRPARPRSAR